MRARLLLTHASAGMVVSEIREEVRAEIDRTRGLICAGDRGPENSMIESQAAHGAMLGGGSCAGVKAGISGSAIVVSNREGGAFRLLLRLAGATEAPAPAWRDMR
jgi:hypothetical protein